VGLIKNCVMDANREMELAELRKEIKKTETLRDSLLEANNMSFAEKVQEGLKSLLHLLEEKEKLGEVLV
jgi:hypothetical protein